MKSSKSPNVTVLSDNFYSSVEDADETSKKKINFFYNGLVESNKENLMLVIFQPDSENPIEIPMQYDSNRNQYRAEIQTPDVCEMFRITKAKKVGDKENPKAEILQEAFISLKDGILQPVNKMNNVPSGELKFFLLKNNGDLLTTDTTDVTTLKNGDRFVSIYFPPGYDPNRKFPYKLQLTLDGGQYLNPMQMNVVMDNLIDKNEIEPVVTVFISPQSGPPKEEAKGFEIVMPKGYTLAMRLQEYCCNPDVSDKLAVLASTMSHQFNVSKNREDITIWGVSAGGLQAVYTGLLHPDIFGNVVAESPMSWNIPKQNGKNWRNGIIETYTDTNVNITWSTSSAELPKKEGEHKEHITKMVRKGYDLISDRKLDISKPIRFYLDAGSKEAEYDPRPEVGSANLLKGAEVFANAAIKAGHTVVDDRVHVIPNAAHHNMTWMRNQVSIMKSMHSSPTLKIKYSETFDSKDTKKSSVISSVHSQSIFSRPQSTESTVRKSEDKTDDAKIIVRRKIGG